MLRNSPLLRSPLRRFYFCYKPKDEPPAGMGRPSNPQSSLFPEDYKDFFNPHLGKFLII